MTPLVDGFGRRIRDLRISVTDRCNLRCVYCMPADPTWLKRDEILSFEEIHRLVRIAVGMGITDFRITGGEPLARKNLPALVKMIAGTPGVMDLALTTNGMFLQDQAEVLREAGLQRINISLDTLSGEKFRHITRRDGLEKVLAGIQEAERVGFRPLKINMVVMRGENEDEIVRFAELSRKHPWQIRFIEFMPLDGDRNWSREKVVPAKAILETIQAEWPLVPANDGPLTEPARVWKFEDGSGDIGVIASVTEPFCHACDRIRITPEGQLRTCLFSHRETDLKTIFRSGAGDDVVEQKIRDAVSKKEAGHGMDRPDFVQPVRAMYEIGG